MLNYFHTVAKPVWDDLNKTKALDGDLPKRIEAALTAFKADWKG
jgi:hypothetical protein